MPDKTINASIKAELDPESKEKVKKGFDDIADYIIKRLKETADVMGEEYSTAFTDIMGQTNISAPTGADGGRRPFQADLENAGFTFIRTLTGMNLQFTSLSMVVGFVTSNLLKYQEQNAQIERQMSSIAAAYGNSWQMAGVGLESVSTISKDLGISISDVNKKVSDIGQSFLGLGIRFRTLDPLTLLFGETGAGMQRNLEESLMTRVMSISTVLAMPMNDILNYMTNWGRRYNVAAEEQLETVFDLADMGEKAGYGYRRFLKDLAQIDDTTARYNFKLTQTASDLTYFTDAIKEGKLSLTDFTNILTGAGKMQFGQIAFLMQDKSFRDALGEVSGRTQDIEAAYKSGDFLAQTWLYKEIWSKHQDAVTQEVYKVIGRISGAPEGAELAFGQWSPHQKAFATLLTPQLMPGGISPTMDVVSIESAWRGVGKLGKTAEIGSEGLHEYNRSLKEGIDILRGTKAWTVTIQAEVANVFGRILGSFDTGAPEGHVPKFYQPIGTEIKRLGFELTGHPMRPGETFGERYKGLSYDIQALTPEGKIVYINSNITVTGKSEKELATEISNAVKGHSKEMAKIVKEDKVRVRLVKDME